MSHYDAQMEDYIDRTVRAQKDAFTAQRRHLCEEQGLVEVPEPLLGIFPNRFARHPWGTYARPEEVLKAREEARAALGI